MVTGSVPTIVAAIMDTTSIKGISTTITDTGAPGTIGTVTRENIHTCAGMEGTIMTAHISCTDFAILMLEPVSSFPSVGKSGQISGEGCWLNHKPPSYQRPSSLPTSAMPFSANNADSGEWCALARTALTYVFLSFRRRPDKSSKHVE